MKAPFFVQKSTRNLYINICYTIVQILLLLGTRRNRVRVHGFDIRIGLRSSVIMSIYNSFPG